MALFAQAFLEDLKAQTDIVAIVNEVTPLKKAGASLKGLCPFHQEKTPSFTVNRDKGFFKCFGCGAGGDAVKFVELQQKLSFPEAVRYLAQRAGLAVPEVEGGPEARAAAAEREELLRIHEEAASFYAEQLASPAAAAARRALDERGLTSETVRTFRYGFAPAGGRDTLQARLSARGISREWQLRSGLVVDRGGRLADWFRLRLMIPIARDTGSVVAFGGRALETGQVPKYLNSRESPIYTKGRTLYGLDVTKGAVRKQNYCVLVEGYFDLAQVWQAGVQGVVASCGTALTTAQARALKRFTSKVVLSFDPDAAGQSAAARSSELLVSEGFRVNVALLPKGSDPDVFIKTQGGRAYRERLVSSQPYLDFLLDRESAGLDLNRSEHRKRFLDAMLRTAATIPDAAERDQFADRLAHKARITEAVVRAEIRRTAAARRTTAPAVALPATVRVRPAEQGLLWALIHRPVEALGAIAQIEPADLEGLLSAPILRLASTLAELPPDLLPELLRERLSEAERALVERAADDEVPAAPPAECVNVFRRLRVERELAEAQQEIDRLQAQSEMTYARFRALADRKKELLRRLEVLT